MVLFSLGDVSSIVLFHKVLYCVYTDAPDITFNDVTTTEGQRLTLTCTADGRPSRYSFDKFIQFWGQTEIQLDGRHDNNGDYILTIEKATYLDMGSYQCRVNNGVPDRGGVVQQSRTTTVTVRGMVA